MDTRLGADVMLWQNHAVTCSRKLAALSVVVAIGALAAYVLLLRVAVIRKHPQGYVVAFALATALGALAALRARAPRWPAWLALGLSSLLLVGGAWFNFVVARVPDTPTVLRVGERPPDFTLPDVAGRSRSRTTAARSSWWIATYERSSSSPSATRAPGVSYDGH